MDTRNLSHEGVRRSCRTGLLPVSGGEEESARREADLRKLQSVDQAWFSEVLRPAARLHCVEVATVFRSQCGARPTWATWTVQVVHGLSHLDIVLKPLDPVQVSFPGPLMPDEIESSRILLEFAGEAIGALDRALKDIVVSE